MLQRQDVTVGKWYVNNKRKVVRAVLQASPAETVSQQRIAGEETEFLTSRQARMADAISSAPVYRGLILLVEDNLANALAVGDYLESWNFQVVVAHNGLEAVARASEINPNLILMDIQMPIMDGLEATRRLRADPRFRSVPIVALTARAMPGDRERCLQAGASQYLSKPVGLKQLVKMIDCLTRQAVLI